MSTTDESLLHVAYVGACRKSERDLDRARIGFLLLVLTDFALPMWMLLSVRSQWRAIRSVWGANVYTGLDPEAKLAPIAVNQFDAANRAFLALVAVKLIFSIMIYILLACTTCISNCC